MWPVFIPLELVWSCIVHSYWMHHWLHLRGFKLCSSNTLTYLDPWPGSRLEIWMVTLSLGLQDPPWAFPGNNNTKCQSSLCTRLSVIACTNTRPHKGTTQVHCCQCSLCIGKPTKAWWYSPLSYRDRIPTQNPERQMHIFFFMKRQDPGNQQRPLLHEASSRTT